MSGVDYHGMEVRKGADTVRNYVHEAGGSYTEECYETVKTISNQRWHSFGCSKRP